MGSVIALNSGKNVVINNKDDLVEVIKEELSPELSNIVNSIVSGAEQEEIYAKLRINSDLDSYESDLENYQNAVNEALRLSDVIIEHLETSSRINRNKIYVNLLELRKELMNV